MKTEFDEDEFQRAIKIVLDYAKRTNKDYIANLRMFPDIDLKPCKSCDNPDYEIEN